MQTWPYVIKRMLRGGDIDQKLVDEAIEELEVMIMGINKPVLKDMAIRLQDAIRNHDMSAVKSILDDADITWDGKVAEYDKVAKAAKEELDKITGNHAATIHIVDDMINRGWLVFYADAAANCAVFISDDYYGGLLCLAIAVGPESERSSLESKYDNAYVRAWFYENQDLIAHILEEHMGMCPPEIVTGGISMLLEKED